jgi:membrane fusion protein (multidrug efflux system)
MPSGPPPVGVVTVERRPMTESYEFNGRIQPINSVNIVARVVAWLDKQLFVEGTDVKKGDLLYTRCSNAFVGRCIPQERKKRYD